MGKILSDFPQIANLLDASGSMNYLSCIIQSIRPEFIHTARTKL